MKTMTCKELGGACALAFHAASFEQIAELSKHHGMEMFQQNDAAHLKAMNAMRALASDPKRMSAWFEEKRAQFDRSPEVDA